MPRSGSDGEVLDTDSTSPVQGGHEVMAVGYDSLGLWFQNSWGTSYGTNGYGRLAWSVVSKDVNEAETINGFASTSGDVTPPTMGAVTEHIAIKQKITDTTAPTKFSWSATGAGGIGTYRLSG